MARAVRAALYEAVAPLAGYYYSYWSGIDGQRVEFYPRDGRVAGILPTNDGLSCIFVGARSRASSTARSSGVSRTSTALGIIPMLNHESCSRKSGY